MNNESKGNGLSGLSNLGNTCYLNSCLQVLSHTYELSKYLHGKTYENKLNDIPDSILLIEWNNLRELMWSQNCTIAPYGFVKAMQNVSKLKKLNNFIGFAQNDTQEFLLYLIDSFHNSLSREVEMSIIGTTKNKTDELASKCYKMIKRMYNNDYSEIIKIFCGIQVSEIKDIESNERLSISPEPFFMLSLSLPNNVSTLSIIDCLNNYCIVERLDGENAWFNEKTGQKQDIDKGLIFWSLPEVLIIHLKRWDYNGIKDNRLVTTEINNLDLRKYVNGYDSQNIYDLYGVCNHSGSSMGGHYTANIKIEDGKWYNFNDTNITKINENNIITNQAYCLFYRKKNIT